MPVKADREYRRIDVAQLELRNDDSGAMTVRGYATTFNAPYVLFEEEGYRVMEEVAPTAFDKTDVSDVIMQYDHQGRVFARTRNGTLRLQPDEHGLLIVADLSGTQIGRQLYEEIKGGYTDRMSFGFTVRGDKTAEMTQDGVRVITRRITDIGKLYDVSAVSLPANPGTEIYSARSFGEGAIARAKQEIATARRAAIKRRRIQILLEVSK